MQFSHSRLDCFESCKFKYKMRYIDKIETLPSTDADNALIIGTAMHTGIEKGVEEAIKTYYNSFPIITDDHVNEAIKLEYLIPKVREILPEGKYELQLMNTDFIGFVDLTSRNDDGSYDIYDFKYSNNVRNYMDSGQLHLYKYFYEKQFNKKVRNLNFVFIPKVNIKMKKTEDVISFRKRIREELEQSEIKIVPIEFDSEKVIEFYQGIKRILETSDFPKEPNYLCNWCEYQEFCEKGVDYMLLPKNERKPQGAIIKKAVWIYGAPFSGKSTIANDFPDPLFLNTDGNLKFLPGGEPPKVEIANRVVVEGRQTKTTMAWEIFKQAISELEKKQNDFKTIVVDLLEDVYEHCRIYIYQREGITHESDNSFKYYDIVRTEFLSTLKRLMSLDYENIILISHEDTSKDITKKSGDKITAIKPNLQDKVATKVAGMVDIVARVVADGNERTLSFKTNEVIFGGGRLAVSEKVIPLDYDEFMKVYEESNAIATGKVTTNKPETRKSNDEEPAEKEEVRSRRTRRVKEEPAEEVEQSDEDFSAQKVQETESQVADAEALEEETEEPAEEKPVRRTRKKRGE